jgi:hypothetical protein
LLSRFTSGGKDRLMAKGAADLMPEASRTRAPGSLDPGFPASGAASSRPLLLLAAPDRPAPWRRFKRTQGLLLALAALGGAAPGASTQAAPRAALVEPAVPRPDPAPSAPAAASREVPFAAVPFAAAPFAAVPPAEPNAFKAFGESSLLYRCLLFSAKTLLDHQSDMEHQDWVLLALENRCPAALVSLRIELLLMDAQGRRYGRTLWVLGRGERLEPGARWEDSVPVPDPENRIARAWRVRVLRVGTPPSAPRRAPRP